MSCVTYILVALERTRLNHPRWHNGAMPAPTRVADALTRHPELFRRAVTATFTGLCPAAGVLIAQPAAHADLPVACAWVLRNSAEQVSDYAAAVIRQLGCEHRRSSTDPAHYALFARALRAGLDAVAAEDDLEPADVAHAAHLLEHCCTLMRDAALAADAQQLPPYIGGTVAQVERRCHRISVIRVQADEPVAYPAGGALAVAGELDPGIWRTLCPAIPANEFGQLEFHVPYSSPGADALIVAPKVGDRWRIAAPYQPIQLSTDADLLLISHGVGLAPLRAIAADVMLQAHPPRIHMFVGADYPGELYDLMSLWHQAASAPYLSVTPVAAHEDDEWWVRPSEYSRPPRGLHLPQTGQAGEVAASYGTWEDRSIIIAGAAADVAASSRALTAAGTPAARIQELLLDERL
ncbi:oxidoreductase [Corynebacterium sp. 13CS0277]|uniref:oxidoreductase n=1 Tax=Corynebacterium sp. 13CS0277 TaxID=2071994 RepID=UPI000D027C7E|nr:oxidoreductase [Corynebacterium sp. 13CS0277]PRQ11808.1 oxidoreductase [Corynebacterium sp. 13CS0277]